MAKKKEKDELDVLADADPKRVIALMLWKARHTNPDLSVVISHEDIKGLADCTSYLEVTPEVLIERPQGAPAAPGIPARGRRAAVPARAAEGPRPFVVVALVQKGTKDGFKPIENSEEGAAKRDQAVAWQKAKDAAAVLASSLMNMAATGDYSTSVVQEASAALRALAT